MHFQLDDLEVLEDRIFGEFRRISHIWESTTAKRMKIDLYCQRQHCYNHWEYFSTEYFLCWFAANFFARRPYSMHCCRMLNLALARLSCISNTRLTTIILNTLENILPVVPEYLVQDKKPETAYEGRSKSSRPDLVLFRIKLKYYLLLTVARLRTWHAQYDFEL